MKPVFLCGFMGSGKSSVGKRLAEMLNCGFVDTDVELERRFSKTVGRIFSEEGEDVFRHQESSLVHDLCDSPELRVIALGGGTLIDENNLKRVLNSGLLVYLRASIKDIQSRIGSDPSRPLLGTDAPDQLLTRRMPGYAAAPHVIETGGLSEDEVAEQIVRILDLT